MKKNNCKNFICMAMGMLWLAICSVVLTMSIAKAQMESHPATDVIVPPPLISQQRELSGEVSPKLRLKEDSVPIESRYNVPLDEELQIFAAQCCEESGIPLELLYAIMQVESRFTVDAVNEYGDTGLLQINNQYASAYGVTDLLDPYQNIKAGTTILSGYLKEYPDDLEKALMLYNCGPNRANELWNEGVFFTQYTKKVQEALNTLSIHKGF